MIFDICICTHSPNITTFKKVLESIGNQTLSRDQFQVLVIDNASQPRLNANNELFGPLLSSGITLKLIDEPNLGVAHARLRALRESKAKAIVFVDDDNVLEKHFLEHAKAILDEHPEVGCFSGKIKLPEGFNAPTWIVPLLGGLAIRDAGETPIMDWFREGWVAWLPVATASMVLTRPVAEAFLAIHGTKPAFYSFGRKGTQSLLSGEDYFIALSAAEAGLKCGYFPELVMWHEIQPKRFKFWYILKLWFSYGITDIKREAYLGIYPPPLKLSQLQHRLLAKDLRNENLRARFCYWVYQVTYVTGRLTRALLSGRKLFSWG